MRTLSVGLFLLLCGCSSGLVFYSPQEMSPQQMLERADLVFLGVIQKQELNSWPFFQRELPAGDSIPAKYWKILRREVRVETVLRGVEPRKVIDVYEISWAGATSGDWNATEDGQRALFLVPKENGKYHVVRDWLRSIFPVTSGPHRRLPLDDSHPFWERIALMNWWMEGSEATARIPYPYFQYKDPARTLSQWRVVKLERGLMRHPSPGVRVPACRQLLALGGWGQDECWEMLSDTDRKHLSDGGYLRCSANEIAATRRKSQERGAEWWWRVYRDRESHRLFTAINNAHLRRQFCDFWSRQYPGDSDNGCPPGQPPPATIVTEQGDVPLLGPWPR